MSERMLLVLGGLLAAGIAYNRLVSWLEQEHPDQPYTASLVVGGVLFTLAGLTLLAGVEIGLLAFGCFAASGLPMVLGSMQRHLEQRRLERRASMEDVLEQLRHVDLNGD